MTALIAAAWLMLAAPTAAPDVVTTVRTPATQPPPAPVQTTPPVAQPTPTPSTPWPTPAPTSAPTPPPPPGPPDSQSTEESPGPQPSEQLGQGALAQQLWDARLRAALNDAEARQGPLDGRWQLTGADGDPLFVLVFSDPGGGAIVGAWRDMRRPTGAQGSGFLNAGARTADGVDIRFTEPGESESVLQLKQSADGRWGGELYEAGAVKSVVLTRF